MKKLLFLCLMLISTTSIFSVSAVVNVIPLPTHCQLSEKSISASIIKTISSASILANEAQAAQEGLKKYAGVDATITKKNGKLQLSINPSLNEEEYTLQVTPKRILIQGGSAKGVFYGVQTLLQEFNNQGKAICGTITDSPRYSWRGFMLDESRHFFGEDQVKQTLDMMAYYKLNKFHWHLTDSPGWRIEIKKYPQLTLKGGIGNHTDKKAPATYYTQDQIRDIVAYAAARHIEVIPEIDMPGHARSATRAYPEFGVEEGSFTYNPGKENVYTFLADVLKEVSQLFPSEYLHIGGDEVSMGQKIWDTDPDIQSLIQREKLNGVKGAEAYFHQRMAPIIKQIGKKSVTWDDVLELGTAHLHKAITWWRHDRMDHLYDALKNNFQTILCPRLPLYFDFVQDSTHTAGRKWWQHGEHNPLSAVYAFPESLFDQWTEDKALQNKILGFQANLWTEVVKTQPRREFMVYPRICALAESAWTSAENKDFNSFQNRLQSAYNLFDKMGIFYCDFRNLNHHPEPKL